MPTGPAIETETFDSLRALDDGDGAFLRELIDGYLADGDERVTALRAAAGAEDREALRRVVHAFKSASASLGALGLAQLCRDLEACASGEPGGELSDLVARLGQEYTRVRLALEKERTGL